MCNPLQLLYLIHMVRGIELSDGVSKYRSHQNRSDGECRTFFICSSSIVVTAPTIPLAPPGRSRFVSRMVKHICSICLSIRRPSKEPSRIKRSRPIDSACIAASSCQSGQAALRSIPASCLQLPSFSLLRQLQLIFGSVSRRRLRI
jgi:hypothetical protein